MVVCVCGFFGTCGAGVGQGSGVFLVFSLVSVFVGISYVCVSCLAFLSVWWLMIE